MKTKIVAILMVVSVLSLTIAQFQTIDSILSAINVSPNLFDGPKSVSSAKLTTAPRSKLATFDQIDYYSHYGVVNCPLYAFDFNCTDCQVIKDDIHSFKKIDSYLSLRALVALSHKRKEIVVSIRGSTTPMDTILNLTFINASPNSKIKIHLGFYIAAMSLYNEVTDAVKCQQDKNPTYQIVLTGHSLGGAIARIFAFYYKFNNQFHGIPLLVLTYGEPRSGNRHYADFLNSQDITTARVVNKADLVPHLPPTSALNINALVNALNIDLLNFIFPDYYVHVLYEVWIKSSAIRTLCNYTRYEDEKCSNSLGPGYTALDHGQYPGASSSQCTNDVINLSSPLNLLSEVTALPTLPRYLQISPKVECGFVNHLGAIDL